MEVSGGESNDLSGAGVEGSGESVKSEKEFRSARSSMTTQIGVPTGIS